MAVRGSFQKRQKEAARREKRQLKLDRRQGRQPVGDDNSPSVTKNGEAANSFEAGDSSSASSRS
ncbi:MAG TPA: hypothetical protein VH437_13585 [Terriglobales bacterium]